MAHVKTRVPNPVAEVTNHGHSKRAAGSTEVADYTWSGVEVDYSYPKFNVDSIVSNYFIVPCLGSQNCSYGPNRMFMWAGFDGALGLGNKDVLQSGVVVTTCPTQYSAVYEWYTDGCTVNSAAQPCYETTINLPVNPGDMIYTTLEYIPGTINPGSAFFLNETTGQHLAVSFQQPSGPAGTRYGGYSVEWVLERDGVNYSNLPDYYLPGRMVSMNTSYGVSGGVTMFPGDDPTGSVVIDIMACTPDSWKPSSHCPWQVINGQQYSTVISYAYYWGQNEQPPPGYYPGQAYFVVAGPAATGNW